MKVKAALLCVLAGLAAASVPSAGYTFADFVAEYGREYVLGSEEYELRRRVFEDHLGSIIAHNAHPGVTYKRGVNQFLDMTEPEFKASGRLGYNKQLARELALRNTKASIATALVGRVDDLPASVDWREKGVVSNVKDQGHCGSCWAFASTEMVESHVALATGSLFVLSPQQLVSCAPNPLKCGGTGGCEGSVPEIAFNYVQLYGMTTEWMMPYTSYFGEDGACKFGNDTNQTKRPAVVGISGYEKLPANNYGAVMHALANVGPLAINIDAGGWHDYASGVFDGCSNSNRSSIDIDHVVQLVGYGTDAALGDYWLVRNSWDTTWGDQGYIRLKRSASPQCGEDTSPADGTGCSGGPPTQRVCGECGLLFDVSYPVGGKVVSHGHHDHIEYV